MQNHVGHEHASTTSIYCVSSDFRPRTPRAALDATVQAAFSTTPTTPSAAAGRP